MLSDTWEKSYGKRRVLLNVWTYDRLCNEVLHSKEQTVKFLLQMGVLKTPKCPECQHTMKLSRCPVAEAKEGFQFRCQKRHFDSSSGSKLINVPFFYRARTFNFIRGLVGPPVIIEFV